MLWDFDDYIEVDSFEGEIYDKLMALVRTAALKIADVLVRMKLERPASNVLTAVEVVCEKDACTAMEAKAGPIEGWEDADTGKPKPESVSEVGDTVTMVKVIEPEQPPPTEVFRLEDIPPEPDVDPWEVTGPVPDLETEGELERRPRVDTTGDPDLISPLTPSDETKQMLYGELERRINVQPPINKTTLLTFPRHSNAGSINESIHLPGLHSPEQDNLVSPLIEASPGLSPSIASRSSFPSTTGQQLIHPAQRSPAPSLLSLTTATSHSPSQRPGFPYFQQPGLEVVNTLIDDGLIPVASETAKTGSIHETSPVLDCNIDDSSSFARYRGFCEGAREALRGAAFGIRKDRKGVSFNP